MLRKINTTLLIIFLIGLLVDGCYFAYTKYAGSIVESKFVEQLGGE